MTIFNHWDTFPRSYARNLQREKNACDAFDHPGGAAPELAAESSLAVGNGQHSNQTPAPPTQRVWSNSLPNLLWSAMATFREHRMYRNAQCVSRSGLNWMSALEEQV